MKLSILNVVTSRVWAFGFRVEGLSVRELRVRVFRVGAYVVFIF